MANSDHAINHCGQRDAIRYAKLTPDDFREEVMVRVGTIVSDVQAGKQSEPHKLPGIEMTAMVVANQVLLAGAKRLCSDLHVNLDELMQHAQSTHISSC